MARRNPMNERYQKNTAPEGKTRKSAASAKPKRSSSDAPGSKKVAEKKSAGPRVFDPPTAEFKRWRGIWWRFLLGSVVVTVASLGLRAWVPQYAQYAGYLLGVGYALIGIAIALDFFKLRPLRKAWIEAGSPGVQQVEKQAKTGAAEKTDKTDTPADAGSEDSTS